MRRFRAVTAGAMTALVAAAVTASPATAGPAAGAAPAPALLAPPDGTVGAFQSDAGVLWTVTDGVGAPFGPAMRTSSSPSVRRTAQGVEMAYHAVTGVLWTVSNGVAASTGLSMKHGTSPRGTAAPDDQIAFHGVDGTLWTFRNGVGASTGLAMKPATSPDILRDPGVGFWMAFQNADGFLSIVDPAGAVRVTGHRMRAGTNPSMVDSSIDSFRHYIAFQSETDHLWLADDTGAGFSTGLKMRPGTSPSLHDNTFIFGTLWGTEVAFQTDVGDLWTGFLTISIPGFAVRANTPGVLWMRPGTSPSLTLGPESYVVAFQSDAGVLWIVEGHGVGASTGLGMLANTSPSIAGLAT